jgi:hypothetical protein
MEPMDGERAASKFVSPPAADVIAHRFSISVRRPGQQCRASFFGARTVSAGAMPFALNHFQIRPEDRQRTANQKNAGSSI